jgi:DNA repair photolyase
MGKTAYIETECRAGLNRVSGMPFRWSLNPYRGCVHGCHYCYARATHPYLGLNADEDFETKIIVKANIPEVLRRELGRTSWTRDRVAIGTATDAYQPCEGRYRLTRRCLETLLDAQTPVSIVTKSTFILRDRDLLAELAQGPGATVYFTITTLDPELWRLIEPGTPPPLKRLRVMQRLSEAGVPCGVFLAPVLPGITDTIASIDTVAAAAKGHGASSFGSAVLRLAPLVKEHYFSFVATHFPDLLPRYERAYSGTNITSDYLAAIDRRLAKIRERYGFTEDAMQRRRGDAAGATRYAEPVMARTGQLALPL